MYVQAFGLIAEPFAPTPDPAFLYLTAQHRDALAAIEYGLRERRGFVTLVGEVGTGKTTTLYTLMESLGDAIDCAYLTHTTLTYDELLRAALIDLGVAEPGHTKGELVATLNRFLHDQSDNGRITALVIDEAQNLSLQTLEELRLLTDYETFQHKLLQIVLVGQPELDQRLAEPQVRQLRDRIAVRARLVPLSIGEVRKYIDHRLQVAGVATAKVFSNAAIAAIARWSEGTPRRINTLCHNALLAAYARGDRQVGRVHVRTAIDELEARDPRSPLRQWWQASVASVRHKIQQVRRPAAAPAPARLLRRRIGVVLAGFVLVMLTAVFHLTSRDPAALESAEVSAMSGVEEDSGASYVAQLGSALSRALDALIPKDSYLEWQRRAHGYRD